MNADEMKQLAMLLQNMPGLKSVELKDVKRLTDLLRDSPEIGSIEVKGFFGTGIVKTADDFGAQGELPSHPELLDWLALDLIENRWDMKKFLKALVMSAAYRQDSRVTPEAL